MSDHPEVLTVYMQMWNERDPELIRGHLDRCVSEDCLCVDPLHNHTGRVALEANVREVRATYPDADQVVEAELLRHPIVKDPDGLVGAQHVLRVGISFDSGDERSKRKRYRHSTQNDDLWSLYSKPDNGLAGRADPRRRTAFSKSPFQATASIRLIRRLCLQLQY